MSRRVYISGSLTALIAAAALSCAPARAEPLFALLTPALPQFFVGPQPAEPQQIEPQQVEPLQSEPQQRDQDTNDNAQLAPRLQRQIVDYSRNEPPGTIVVDTPHTHLYYVLGSGKAIRYGIGVGREGFTWAGTKAIERKAEWPDWYPPAEMVARQPYLPRVTLGGPGNPLGARSLYIGGTQYRIHGTNDPTTIGKNVSSGCIRLTNEDIKDLYSRAQIGAKVVVLPQTPEAMREAKTEAKSPAKDDWQAKARAAIAAAGRSQATANGLY